MAWLMVYGSVAVAVLAALTLCYGRSAHGDALRLIAVLVAAALWPVVAVGALQYGAIRVIATCLRHHCAQQGVPVTAEAEPATVPKEFAGSLVRLTAQISGTRPA